MEFESKEAGRKLIRPYDRPWL